MVRLSLVLLLAGVTAPALADRVTLSTGEVLLVTVVEQTDERLVLDHPVLGRLTLAPEQVYRVRHEAEAADPAPAREPSSAPAPAQPADPPAEEPAPDAGSPAGLIGSPFLAGWTTKLSLGLSGSAGNTDRFNTVVQFDGRHKTKSRRATWDIDWFVDRSNGRVSRNQLKTKFTRDWLAYQTRRFAFLTGEYEHNEQRRFRDRAGAYGGFGYRFIEEDDFELSARVGAGGTYEWGDVDEFSPEAVFGGSAANWQLTEHQELSAECTIYPDLEESGRSRINAKLDWVLKLPEWNHVRLKLGLVDDYESFTDDDEKHNDLKYYSALLFKF